MCKVSLLKSHIVWFIVFSIIVTAAAAVVMNRAEAKLKESHDLIIVNQNRSIILVDSLLSIRNSLTQDSIKYTPIHLTQLCEKLDDAIKTLDAQQNNSRVASLLELEFSKIQSEYDVLNLWCALLTVVFLIFSFFSIFKTNEMSNQSEAALANMRSTASAVQSKSEDIDAKIIEAKAKISRLETSIQSLGSKEKDITAKFQSLKDDDFKDLQEKVTLGLKNQIDLEERKGNFNDELKNIFDSRIIEFSQKLSDQTSGLNELIYQKVKECWEIENQNLLNRISNLETENRSLNRRIDDVIQDKAGGEKTAEDDEESEIGLTDEDDIPTNKTEE